MNDGTIELIRRVLRGDADAWRALWGRSEPIVLDVAGRTVAGRRLGASPDERRSVVVATMARLESDGYRRLRMFLEDSERRADGEAVEARFVAWLATVATRVAIDRARAGKNVAAAIRSERIDPAHDVVDRGAPDMERRATARSVLQRARADLSRNQFDALLAWLVGDDAETIARRLDLADASEADRLVRAGIKRLRDRYRADDSEEGMES